VGFPQLFRSPTAWENLDRDTLQYRLLLALYGQPFQHESVSC